MVSGWVKPTYANVWQTPDGKQFVGLRVSTKKKALSLKSYSNKRVALLRVFPK